MFQSSLFSEEDDDAAEQAVVVEFTPATPDIIQPSPSSQQQVVFYDSHPNHNHNGETFHVVVDVDVDVDEEQPVVVVERERRRMEEKTTKDSAHAIVVQEESTTTTRSSQDENNNRDHLVKASSLLASAKSASSNGYGYGYSGQHSDTVPVNDERNLEHRKMSAVDQVKKDHDPNTTAVPVPEPQSILLKKTETMEGSISDADRAHYVVVVQDAEPEIEKSIVDQINLMNKKLDDTITHMFNPSSSNTTATTTTSLNNNNNNNGVQDPIIAGRQEKVDSDSVYRDALSQEEGAAASVDQSHINPHFIPAAFREDDVQERPSQEDGVIIPLEQQAGTAFPAAQSEDPNDTQVMKIAAAEDRSEPTTTDDVPVDPEDEAVLMKRKHWQESPFAVGLVNPQWADDRISCRKANATSASCCQVLSAYVCGCVGAGRVGNMAVLAQRVEEYNHIEVDEVTGEQIVTRQMRPRPVWVVGPYWPVNCFVTFPLIFSISIWTALTRVKNLSVGVQVTYWMCIILLVYSLAMVACRNPGIMYRQRVKPEGEDGWRWNDQARTWRPPKARYDPECALVIDGFDHTCPWTGTAIGADNMIWFKVFVTMVPVCIAYVVVVQILL